jgi:exosortase A-associated hydrolase 2
LNAPTLPRTAAFFLARGESDLFCVLHSPPADIEPVGALLHVPAIAEEMNKARRAVSLAARALALRGWHVLLLDPTGTGDSSGDFGHATWKAWQSDIRDALRWLHDRTGLAPGLWGLRSGCLLVSDALEHAPAARVLFWQPQLSGETALTQFLRLRTMSGIGDTEQPRDTTKALLAELESGRPVDVAGYSLSPELALPWRRARLGGSQFRGCDVTWLEVSQFERPALAPASETCIGQFRTTGATVRAQALAGLNFWMTQEIDEPMALISATVQSLAAAA